MTGKQIVDTWIRLMCNIYKGYLESEFEKAKKSKLSCREKTISLATKAVELAKYLSQFPEEKDELLYVICRYIFQMELMPDMAQLMMEIAELSTDEGLRDMAIGTVDKLLKKEIDEGDLVSYYNIFIQNLSKLSSSLENAEKKESEQ